MPQLPPLRPFQTPNVLPDNIHTWTFSQYFVELFYTILQFLLSFFYQALELSSCFNKISHLTRLLSLRLKSHLSHHDIPIITYTHGLNGANKGTNVMYTIQIENTDNGANKSAMCFCARCKLNLTCIKTYLSPALLEQTYNFIVPYSSCRIWWTKKCRVLQWWFSSTRPYRGQDLGHHVNVLLLQRVQIRVFAWKCAGTHTSPYLFMITGYR